MTKTQVKTFYKENGTWYIDLPEFLEAGLGTKANLMMVAGADTLLDELSDNGNRVTLAFSDSIFSNSEELYKWKMGMDKEYLDSIGHAPVDYGAYYINSRSGHVLWL